MTTWTPEDRERIRTALSLPASRIALDAIALGMNWLTANYPDGIATVQAKLSKLESLLQSSEEVQNSANFNLKKAGELEWDLSAGSKTSGIEAGLSRLRFEIAIALGLDLDLLAGSSGGSGGWGSGQLLRS